MHRRHGGNKIKATFSALVYFCNATQLAIYNLIGLERKREFGDQNIILLFLPRDRSIRK